MLRRVEAQQLTALLLSNCAISWYYAGMTRIIMTAREDTAFIGGYW